MEHGLVPATGKARRTGLYPRVWRRAKINESKRKWAEHFSFWPTVRKIRGWSARVICVWSNKKKGGKGRKKEERILLLQRCTDFWMKNRWIENERFQEVDNEAWSFLGCTCDRIRIVKRCSDSGWDSGRGRAVVQLCRGNVPRKWNLCDWRWDWKFFRGRLLCDFWSRKDKADRLTSVEFLGEWVDCFSSGIELGREGTVLWKGHMQRRSEFARGRGKRLWKKWEEMRMNCHLSYERKIKIKNR